MISCTFEDGGVGKLRHVTVDCIIEKDKKILLIKRAFHLLEGGKWALPGGFLDRDESIVDAVKREVKEETGYDVDSLELFLVNSNPDRPKEDRQNVDIVFLAIPKSKTGKSDNEVKEQRWFSFNDIESTDIAFDHKMLLKKYIEHSEKSFSLPMLI